MAILEKLKPKFWDHHDAASVHHLVQFSFKRKWKLLVVLTSLVAIAPLALLALIGYDTTTRAIEAEIRQNTRSLVTNIVRAASLHMAEHHNTFEIDTCKTLLDQLDLGNRGDAFVIDRNGTLITSPRHHGNLLAEEPWPLPLKTSGVTVFERNAPDKGTLIIGYGPIADTSMGLVIVRFKEELMREWQSTRNKFLIFLGINVVVIILVILGMATYMVNRIHTADAKRVMALHQVEYANKIASLSRLSAGVAHEINNPLAIIGEKAGLMKDLLQLQPEHPCRNERLIGLADDTLSAVKRCGTVTQRLLNFARHMETCYEMISLEEIINELITFLQKEAEYRCIRINIDFPENLPKFESDRGNLQQIFLNLLNNAFAAINDGGRLDISGKMLRPGMVEISIRDDGHGIPAEDLPHIFEPFFSSKNNPGGTGLGLSITYGLIREIGGQIRVESELNKGTLFSIELPLKPGPKSRKNVCSYY